MTKEQFIEMVQGLCASGDLQSDIRGRYGYNRIAAITNQVVSSIFSLDVSVADQMAALFPIEVKFENDKFRAVLPVSPMNGARGIRSCFCDGVRVPFNNNHTDFILSSILGGSSGPEGVLSNRVVTIHKPIDSWVLSKKTLLADFYIVPDILSMDDNVEFINESYSETIAVRVVEIVKSTDSRVEEKINNTNQDVS